MTDSKENVDNESVLTEIIAIRENNKRPDNKAIKDYINKNFAPGVEEVLIQGIVMELLDHNIIEKRLTTNGNTYFIRKKKKKNTSISIKTTPQVKECELVRDTDQHFNKIILKSQYTPAIRRTPNMLSHTEDTPNIYKS